jgi:hypothetical protein
MERLGARSLPQIDHPTLLERMSAILSEASGTRAVTTAGHWQAPMKALNGPLRTFADVYGADGAGLLGQLSRDASARGEPHMARLYQTLEVKLRNGSLLLEPDRTPAPRLIRFVYPVV